MLSSMSLAQDHIGKEQEPAFSLIGFICLTAISLSLFPQEGRTNQMDKVTLTWDPSPSLVAGYSIYYGVQTGVYTNRLFCGPVTAATVPGLVQGVTYYFVATATDMQGLESDFSNEVSYTVPLGLGPLTIAIGPDGQISISGTATPVTTYNILASETLLEWRLVSTVTTDAEGTYVFADSLSTTNSAGFYRLQLLE